MNPKLQGERTEAKVLSKLLDCGYIVAVPFGSQRYDFIVDDGKKLLKVQAKTGRVRAGCVVFRACSIDGSSHKARTYHGEIDAFAVYVPDNNKFYWIPISKLPNRYRVVLRLDPVKNGQIKRVRLAIDFEF